MLDIVVSINFGSSVVESLSQILFSLVASCVVTKSGASVVVIASDVTSVLLSAELKVE